MRLTAAAWLALAAHACSTPATEALVQISTDVPGDRSMRITAAISTVGGGDTDSHAWTRAYGDASGIALPATFAVLPAPGGALDGRVTLTITADVGRGPRGEAAGQSVRVVEFVFAPHQARRIE